MAVNVPTAADFGNNVERALVNLRNDFQTAVNLNDYVNSMGGANFLSAAAPAGLGLSTADAAAMVATLGNHAALATQYVGGAQAPVLNYKANGSPFWGGQ
jgi:hypothetical protein